jgi:hypothetical protein
MARSFWGNPSQDYGKNKLASCQNPSLRVTLYVARIYGDQ